MSSSSTSVGHRDESAERPDATTTGRSRVRRLSVLWWLVPAIGSVVLFAPSLFGGQVLLPADILDSFAPWSSQPGALPPDNPLLRDLVDTYQPEQATIWERLTGDGYAGWLPDSGLGAPGWWFVGTGALSPFVILGQLFGLGGIAIGAVLRLTVAGAGVGLAARNWGASRAAATLTAGCYAFSGFMISWLGWPQTHVGAAVGWVWWASTRAARDDAPAWAVPAVALSMAGAWFGGFPAIAALLGLSAIGLSTAEAFTCGGGRWRGLGRGASGLVVGTTLAAVQLLPSVAFLGTVDLSARSEAWRGSLPVQLIARWIAPDVFGDGQGVAYWGRINLIEGAAFVGVPALILAGTAIVWRITDPWVRRVTVLTAVTGLFVYGFPPLIQLGRILPGLDTNPPARGIVLTCAGVSILAGLGLDGARRHRAVSRAGLATLGALAVGMVGFVVIARPDRQVRELAALRLVTPELRDAAVSLVRDSVVEVATVGLVTVTLILLVRRAARQAAAGSARPWLPIATGAVVALAVLHPFLAAVGWNTQVPRAEVYPQVAALDALAAAAPPPARIAGTTGMLLPMTDLRYGFNDARGRRFMTRELTALVRAAGGEFSSPTRWDLAADPAAWTHAVGALGITGIVVGPDVVVPGDLGPVDGAPEDLGALRLVRITDPTPFASVAEQVQVATLAESPGILAAGRDPGTALVSADVGPVPTGPAELLDVTRDGRDVQAVISAPDGALFRVLDAFGPGWSATIDRRPADVVRVDGAFVGVVVPPGATAVALQWQAPLLVPGIVISLISLVGLMLWGGVRYRRPDSATNS